MADQHNANIPAMGNTIAADIPDIKENLEYHKDVFEAFVNSWSNTTATNIKPKIVGDADNDTLIQCEESADEDIIRFDTGGTGNAFLFAANSFTQNSVLRRTWVTSNYSGSGATSYQFTGLSEKRMYRLQFYANTGSDSDYIVIQFNEDTSGGYYGNYDTLTWNGSSIASGLEHTDNGNYIAMTAALTGGGTHSGTYFITGASVVVQITGTGFSYYSTSEHKSLHSGGRLNLGSGSLTSIEIKGSDGHDFTGTFVLEELS